MSTARTTAARGNLEVFGAITADRFEYGVEVAGRAERCDETSRVDLAGPKIVEHRTRFVEQGFDVEQFDRRVTLLDRALTQLEAPRPLKLEAAGVFKIVGSCGSENLGCLGRSAWGNGLLWRRHDLDEDLTKFRPTVRANDDHLAAFEAGRIRGKTADLTPQAVSDQVVKLHPGLTAHHGFPDNLYCSDPPSQVQGGVNPG
jgi:hypothetical protein